VLDFDKIFDCYKSFYLKNEFDDVGIKSLGTTIDIEWSNYHKDSHCIIEILTFYK
jgi:hypothetical protein